VKPIFADTLYWIALVNSRDQWRQSAASLNAKLSNARLVTTDGVLTELANFFAEYGDVMGRKVALTIRAILEEEQIEVVTENRQTFLAGLAFYEARLDKAYSLTDCRSMNVMKERGIVDVLTHDSHFTQEGFNVLL
jgi:predicted nucleic acid-binding protein